jgi:hypothetical protein
MISWDDLAMEAQEKLFGRLLKSRPNLALSEHRYQRLESQKVILAHAMVLVSHVIVNHQCHNLNLPTADCVGSI